MTIFSGLVLEVLGVLLALVVVAVAVAAPVACLRGVQFVVRRVTVGRIESRTLVPYPLSRFRRSHILVNGMEGIVFPIVVSRAPSAGAWAA